MARTRKSWISIFTIWQVVHSVDYETIAAGDSFNDLGMIRASKAGFLFRAPESIRAANPDLPAFETYAGFFDGICKAL